MILIFFIVLVFKGLAYSKVWEFDPRERMAILAFLGITPFILVLPARLVDKVIPDYYGTISDAVTTLLFLTVLIISMFLLRRFLQHVQTETIRWRANSHDIQNDSQ